MSNFESLVEWVPSFFDDFAISSRDTRLREYAANLALFALGALGSWEEFAISSRDILLHFFAKVTEDDDGLHYPPSLKLRRIIATEDKE